MLDRSLRFRLESTTVDEKDTHALGKLLGMVVHDLRNPGATIGANVSFVAELADGKLDPDAMEALEDVERALSDMMMGLEHVGWIGRWLADEQPIATDDGFLHDAVAKLRPPPPGLKLEVELPEEPIRVRGGGRALQKVLQLFVENSVQHARRGIVSLRGWQEGDTAIVELLDDGTPLSGEYQEAAFSLEGQLQIKGKAEGRYGRVAALFAAKILCDAIGARIEAGEADGQARFRLIFATSN